MKINLILTIFLGIIILIATAQGARPTFKGDPAASAWYTDTSIPNGLEDYGGVFDPRANPDWRTTNVYDQINVFARSDDDKLLWYRLTYHPGYDEASGTLSVVFPRTLRISSSPSVVQRGPNTIDVFVVGAFSDDRQPRETGRHLYDLIQLEWDGSSWSRKYVNREFTTQETASAGGIAAAWWGDPNRIDLFVTTNAEISPWRIGYISHYIWDGRNVQDYFDPRVENITPEEGGFNLDPRGEFGRGHLMPPGGAKSAPAAGSWGPNHLDLVVRGRDNSYYRNSYDLGRWSGWQSIGGIFTSAPSITPTPPFPGGGGERKINIFGRGGDMGLYAKGIRSDGPPTIWGDYGGGLNSAPAAINYVGDHFTVFARGMDNTLWWLDWDVGAEDFRWQPVPDLLEVETREREVEPILTEEEGSIILMVNDTNIPGSDYRDFDLKIADPKLCAQVCTDDPTCVACTYVKPGYQGPNARCWLKNNVASQVQDECCVSGVKGEEANVLTSVVIP
ncbi:MAG: PAN domain-containing protein [Methanotrichaceae archaeon]|nr:PAN domain-containing protein [Methanotrichaceae archaeon]